MRDLCDYFGMDPRERMEEAGDIIEDPDTVDEERAELERLGVHFNEGDSMVDPNEHGDPFAVVEGAEFPDDDAPEWDYEEEYEDEFLDDSDLWDDDDWFEDDDDDLDLDAW